MVRRQRFAAFLAVAEIADRLSPEVLTVSLYVIEQKRQDAVPALAALARIAPTLRAVVTAGDPAAVSALKSRRRTNSNILKRSRFDSTPGPQTPPLVDGREVLVAKNRSRI